MMNRFHYLKPALAVVLLVVGVKMMSHSWLKTILGAHFNFYILGLILLILSAGVVLSLLLPHRKSAIVT